MPTNAEILYGKLRTASAVIGLVGRTEDSDFECKEWFPVQSMKESLAKAACGFTNAMGGVIIIGLKARKRADGIDAVQESKPVDNAEAVRSEALEAISNLVEPGIEGIQSKVVRLAPKSKQGFVLIFIPESQGSPHRSRCTPKEFYVRIGPQTMPMAYFQIEDRFGRRPHARLIVNLKHHSIRHAYLQANIFERIISVEVTNEGRGLARFPAIRCQNTRGVSAPHPMHTLQPIWAISHADNDWLSFRGGANDVVYPGESLQVALLVQVGTRANNSSPQVFAAVTICTEVVCEAMPAFRQSFAIEAYER